MQVLDKVGNQTWWRMRHRGFSLLVLLLASPVLAVKQSQQVWQVKCKRCHGEDGRGRTNAGRQNGVVDLTSPEWQQRASDRFIRRVITDGSRRNRKMRPFKYELSRTEIDALVKLIRRLQS
jgi:mono/diheme cytochrome c family protein